MMMLNMTADCDETGETAEKLYPNVLGTIICCLGCPATIFLLAVFRSYQSFTPNTIFLMALAAFDIGVMTTYMLMFPIKTIAIKLHYVRVYRFHIESVKFLYPLARFCQMSTSYITIIAALERVMTLTQFSGEPVFGNWRTHIWLGSAILLSAGSHISRYFEILVHVRPDCSPDDMAYKDVGPGGLLFNPIYRTFFSWWYTNIANILFPFFVLLLLVTLNTVLLRKYTLLSMALIRVIDRNAGYRRDKLRDQTVVLIVLVSTYIVLNTPTVVTIVLEIVDDDIDPLIYGILAETCNICAIINSSVRLINYMTFNKNFRNQAQILLGCKSRNHGTRKRSDASKMRSVFNSEMFGLSIEADPQNSVIRPTEHKKGTLRLVEYQNSPIRLVDNENGVMRFTDHQKGALRLPDYQNSQIILANNQNNATRLANHSGEHVTGVIVEHSANEKQPIVGLGPLQLVEAKICGSQSETNIVSVDCSGVPGVYSDTELEEEESVTHWV